MLWMRKVPFRTPDFLRAVMMVNLQHNNPIFPHFILHVTSYATLFRGCLTLYSGTGGKLHKVGE